MKDFLAFVQMSILVEEDLRDLLVFYTKYVIIKHASED